MKYIIRRIDRWWRLPPTAGKAKREIHINVLLQVLIQKGISYIKLNHRWMKIAYRGKNSLTKTSLATGENVSMKSTPSCCINPFATKSALCLSIVPYALYFVLYSHLHPILCLPTRRETIDHVLFCSMANISATITFLQTWCLTASK